jgi:hypothetical protein
MFKYLSFNPITSNDFILYDTKYCMRTYFYYILFILMTFIYFVQKIIASHVLIQYWHLLTIQLHQWHAIKDNKNILYIVINKRLGIEKLYLCFRYKYLVSSIIYTLFKFKIVLIVNLSKYKITGFRDMRIIAMQFCRRKNAIFSK